MKVKPLGDRLVVRRFDSQEKTSGGIILPDSAKNKPQKGTVLAVGPSFIVFLGDGFYPRPRHAQVRDPLPRLADRPLPGRAGAVPIWSHPGILTPKW